MLRFFASLVLATTALAQQEAFNLGALGAEGLPVEKPDPAFRLPAGAVAVQVTSVMAAGPAREAGLQADDLIVGFGKSSMVKNTHAVYQLVEAVEQGGAAKSPEVDLAVRRRGKLMTIKVALPQMEAHSATCPATCPRCDTLVGESLKLLAGMQRADGGFACKLGGVSGECVVTCVAALSFIASGSGPETGPWAENIRKATTFIVKKAGTLDSWMADGKVNGKNYDQTHWSLSFGAYLLVEVQRLRPSDEIAEKLKVIMQTIEKNQEASGGWGHGPGGPNGEGYLEFQAMGNFQLAALGAIRRAGLKPSQAVIDRGVAFALACESDDGGIRYSKEGMYYGGEAGRTAGFLWAISLLDMKKLPLFTKGTAFLKANLATLPEGHSSPVLHFLIGAIASTHLGEPAWKDYESRFRLEFLAQRRPDGTFLARPGKRPPTSGQGGTDRFIGPAWALATDTLALQMRKGHLKVIVGASK